MAISKRLRFEVLRRDNHTCRYCGRTAPEVRLTVDHVTPSTLGGKDVPENLVAACSDCNGGKSSVPPDAPLVADVLHDAVRWRRAMEEAGNILRARREERLAYGDAFIELWERWTFKQGKTEHKVPVDNNWRASVENFFDHGLDIADLHAALETAMGADHVAIDNRFRYFCGVCWNMVADLQGIARQLVEADGDD